MMDVYKRTLDIESHLYPKLESAAKVWCDDAKRRIIEKDDPETIISELEYSLKLYDSPQTRAELDAFKETISQ